MFVGWLLFIQKHSTNFWAFTFISLVWITWNLNFCNFAHLKQWQEAKILIVLFEFFLLWITYNFQQKSWTITFPELFFSSWDRLWENRGAGGVGGKGLTGWNVSELGLRWWMRTPVEGSIEGAGARAGMVAHGAIFIQTMPSSESSHLFADWETPFVLCWHCDFLEHWGFVGPSS